jgi:hypothetical protein
VFLQKNRRPWGVVRVFLDVGGLHTPGLVLGGLLLVGFVVSLVVTTRSSFRSGWSGLLWAPATSLFVFGACVLLGDGDLGVLLGPACSARALDDVGRCGLGGRLPFRAPSLGGFPLGALLPPLVDVVEAHAIT